MESNKPPSSSGLGHHPFKVAARVRIPLGVRNTVIYNLISAITIMFFNDQSVEFMSSLWSRGEAGVHAGLSSRRSRVRVPSGPPSMADRHCLVDQPEQSGGLHGRVAQLAEHTPEKRGVTGSTPVSTTICVALMRILLLRVVAKSYQSFLRHCCYMCSVL